MADNSGSGAGGERVTGIRPDAVTQWFSENVEGVQPPLGFEVLAGGHSNLTYRVGDATGASWVLRRPPTGLVLATAHDMAREYRIIAALGPTAVPVPQAIGLCEDESVNDAPFYVMSHVEGTVLAQDVEAEAFSLDQRAVIGRSVADVLGALHTVDPDAVGLGELGRKEAYLTRQIKRWRRQWSESKTRELAAMDEVAAALEQHMPEQIGAAIVHGDYRLGNMMVRPDGVAAVLDWELCTLGDPLADVGYVLNNWVQPGEMQVGRGAANSPTMAGGFGSRQQLVERYEEITGRSVGDVSYYQAFQYWRLAAIVEGVLARYLEGVMANEADTDIFRDQVENLATAALDLAEGWS
ncbi:MAG: phosphotransferase family protein [Actinomycetia bacterium]|nr:phosphotransferase family protein [Actinomycetes bacterium]